MKAKIFCSATDCVHQAVESSPSNQGTPVDVLMVVSLGKQDAGNRTCKATTGILGNKRKQSNEIDAKALCQNNSARNTYSELKSCQVYRM